MGSPKVQEMLDIASRAAQRLDKARTSIAARNAWVEFIESSNRAINRLEGYSKQNGKEALYKELVTKTIWSSPLATYMRLARNAHEHGVVDTLVDEPYDERVVFPNGAISGSPISIGITAEGEEIYMPKIEPGEYELGPGARVIRLPPGIMPVPVRKKDQSYAYPPYGGELKAEDESMAAALARRYLAWVIDQCSKFD